MKKFVLALAICLMVAFLLGAQAAAAQSMPTMATQSSLFDLSKQKAMLNEIRYKLATGGTGNIAAGQKAMDSGTRQSANDIYAETSGLLNARMSKPTATVKAPKTAISMPGMPGAGLQSTAKSLENLNFKAPSLKKMFLDVV